MKWLLMNDLVKYWLHHIFVLCWQIFNKNFFGDWRKRMTLEERAIIRDFTKCDFTNIHAYLKQQAQIRKDRYAKRY